ncbi:MAG: 6-phosphogluconolactonase [Acidobacteriota bacterium]
MSFVRRYPHARAAAIACGEEIVRLLGLAIDARGRATLAISGGTSPKFMFEWFAQSGFEWAPVHVFWVDERCVPPDDPQSNYKLAYDAWLKDVPHENVHRVQTELEPDEAARRYAEQIHPFLPFDVIHRGMGADAHTASLFPGDPLINDLTGTVGVARRAVTRITLLPSVLESARHTVILATGPDKAEPLDAVLRGPHEPLHYPAQIAALDPATATWFIDEAAAASL